MVSLRVGSGEMYARKARLLQNSFGFPVTFLGGIFGLSHTCLRPIGLLQEAYQA